MTQKLDCASQSTMAFSGARRKRMPQRVKMHSLKAAFAGVLFHPVLQGSWLHEAVRTSQNISG